MILTVFFLCVSVGKSNLSNNINIFNEIRTSIIPEDKHPVIVIDSLSSALVLIDLNLLYRQVHQLMNLALGKGKHFVILLFIIFSFTNK